MWRFLLVLLVAGAYAWYAVRLLHKCTAVRALRRGGMPSVHLASDFEILVLCALWPLLLLVVGIGLGTSWLRMHARRLSFLTASGVRGARIGWDEGVQHGRAEWAAAVAQAMVVAFQKGLLGNYVHVQRAAPPPPPADRVVEPPGA